MPKKLTKDEFINRCIANHGDKYTYEKVEYVGSHAHVTVTCKKHGHVDVTPSSFMAGRGCRYCAWESNGTKKRVTKDEFINRSIERHGDKYDYSNVDYEHTTVKVCIGCKDCGTTFMMNPEQHMLGQGCRKCGYEKNASKKRKDTQSVLKELIKVHGDKYLYPDFTYENNRKNIKVLCVHCQVTFVSSPARMLKGSGCPICSASERGFNSRSNTEAFVTKAKELHKDKYDYSLTLYVKSDEKVDVLCKKHGVFRISPNRHLAGHGCKECGLEYLGEISRKTQEAFLEDAKKVHGDFYGYDNTAYKDRNTKVEIRCPYHGYFWQNPGTHTQGGGCPNCGNNGYKTRKHGYIYVLTYNNLTKVGITNKDPKIRCKYIANDSGKDFKIHSYFRFENGQHPLDIETLVLRELTKDYEQPTEKFSGSTECFYNLLPEIAMQRILELSANLTETPTHVIIQQ